jgi:Tol biopolymer transport system component
MDPVEGRPTGSPQPIPYWRTGRNVNPVWSPDGTRLAFVSSAAAEKNRHFVVVMSAAGGQAREFLIPTTSSQSDLRWFGNGRGLGLSGRDTRGATAVFRLLLDTGEWNTIPLSDREAQTRIEWNHDGSAFYFARVTLAGLKDDGGIFERAVNGNAERLVYRLAPDSAVQTLEFSHDRKSLAIRQATYKGITQTIKIVAVDVVTGEARTALVVEPSSVELGIALASWTPSGDLLVRRPTGQSTATAVAPAEFLLVPTNGGTPRTFAIPRIAPIGSGDTSSVERVVKWSPDGRTMLIGTESRGGQMFIIENPLAATRATTTGRR